MESSVRVLVSIDPSHPGGSAGIANALRAAGASIGQVLDELGTITATCSSEGIPALSRVPGVLHVEPERTVSVPKPGSKVQ
ncbi:MAG TPA: hypothetical protein VG937_08000 [Polyangiaceae bacterium]|nr:hypothetical protein [Polyangiaceae bacterium]